MDNYSSMILTWVTPFVGVWIEITVQTVREYIKKVTPFVGVWIEISDICHPNIATTVTPFVGVWIEIISANTILLNILSLPSWECGLK